MLFCLQLFLEPWVFCVSWQPWDATVWLNGWQTTRRISSFLLCWTTAWTGLSGWEWAVLPHTSLYVEWLPWVASSCPNQRSRNLKNPPSLPWTCSTEGLNNASSTDLLLTCGNFDWTTHKLKRRVTWNRSLRLQDLSSIVSFYNI